MRIGIISYPMLFQRLGGLQVQVRETLEALNAKGLEARYIDIFGERLADFDVVHVFGVINGNHRIIEAARDQQRPTVLSTVLHPPFTAWDRRKAEWADRLTGRLTDWQISTSYRQIRRGLDLADHIIALGADEKTMLAEGYGQAPDRVAVIPNGVGTRFFDASPKAFADKFAPQRSVILCAASINPRKNQLAAAKAVRELEADLHLFGPCAGEDQAYLEQVRAAGDGSVIYHGSLDYADPLLPSAYVAADMMILVSVSEVMPISVLEALAAGTPVVMGKSHSLGLDPVPGILEMVDHDDVDAIRAACRRILENPPDAAKVRDVVAHLSWGAVGDQLIAVYEAVIKTPPGRA